ncbi:MAG: alpha/beta hydrolase [Bacteroidia bacterium]|nr:alpha/beta hydrolase [Bacteroidia bacterium]
MLRLSVWNVQRLIRMDVAHIPDLRRTLDLSSRALTLPFRMEAKPLNIGQMRAEWLIGSQSQETRRVLLFVHGGGYAVGSLQTHRGLAGAIAQAAGARCLLIDYRLAPEHPFPAGLEDAALAYQYLLQQGYAPHEIAIAGDSAGGGLSLALLLSLRELGVPLPAACVCMSPWVDLTFSGESAKTFASQDPIVLVPQVRGWADVYAGRYALEHPMISPLYADLSGLPPVLIQASDSEVLTDDARRLGARLAAAGNDVTLQIWPGTLHVWQLFWRYIPEAEDAVARIGRFLQARWTSAASGRDMAA